MNGSPQIAISQSSAATFQVPPEQASHTETPASRARGARAWPQHTSRNAWKSQAANRKTRDSLNFGVNIIKDRDQHFSKPWFVVPKWYPKIDGG